MYKAPEWSGNSEGGDIIGWFPGDPDTSAGGIHQRAQELLGIETGNYGKDFSFRDRVPKAALEGGRRSPTAEYTGAEPIEPGKNIQEYLGNESEDIDYIFVDLGDSGHDTHNLQAENHEIHFETYKFSPRGNDGKVSTIYEDSAEYILDADYQPDVDGYRVTRLTETEDIPIGLWTESQNVIHRVSERLPNLPVVSEINSATKTEWPYEIESMIYNSDRIDPEELGKTLNDIHSALDNQEGEVTSALARKTGEKPDPPSLRELVETLSEEN